MACLLFAGCGTGDQTSVSGKAVFRGKPIAEGVLRFFPVGETPGPGAGANIEGGSYAIASEKGLAPGEYRVSITATRKTGRMVRNVDRMPGEPEMNPEMVQYLPESYNVQSKLRVKLEAGENEHDFP